MRSPSVRHSRNTCGKWKIVIESSSSVWFWHSSCSRSVIGFDLCVRSHADDGLDGIWFHFTVQYIRKCGMEIMFTLQSRLTSDLINGNGMLNDVVCIVGNDRELVKVCCRWHLIFSTFVASQLSMRFNAFVQHEYGISYYDSIIVMTRSIYQCKKKIAHELYQLLTHLIHYFHILFLSVFWMMAATWSVSESNSHKYVEHVSSDCHVDFSLGRKLSVAHPLPKTRVTTTIDY